ncbi:MAG: DinB family protein [Gemmatimonadota bacterium]
MPDALTPLREMARLHTRLFLNALDGVDDEAAARRPGGRTNNITFVALHALDARCWLAGYLGEPLSHPVDEDLKDVESLDDIDTLPPLEDVREAWREASRSFETLLGRLEADALTGPSPMPFPIDDTTTLGGLVFMLHHEAFHVGQLALLRRYAGLDALSYE